MEPIPVEHKTGSQVPITGTSSTADGTASGRAGTGKIQQRQQTKPEVVEETR